MPSNNAIVGQQAAASRMPQSVFKGSVPGFHSMNFGRIVPVFMKYMEAHSKMALSVNTLIRGATPITPTMGNSAMELHAFSVPWRIIWNYAKQFFGENDTSAWTQTNNYTKPKIKLRIGELAIMPSDSTVALSATSGSKNTTIASQYISATRDFVKIGELGYLSGTERTAYGLDSNIEYALYVDVLTSDCYGPNKLADYLGLHPIPANASREVLLGYYDTFVANSYSLVLPVDALPFRAFFSIVNYYYRDQNYQAPYLFSKDNGDLLLGTTANEVGRLPMPYDFMERRSIGQYAYSSGTGFGMEGSAFVPPASRLKDPFSTIVPEPLKGDQYDLLSIAGLAPVVAPGNYLHSLGGDLLLGPSDGSTFGSNRALGVGSSDKVVYGAANTGPTASGNIGSSNLYADLAQASKITLEKFRDFVVLSQWNEKAVKGTRYAEILQEFYGVPVNPALLDEPRFLGGVQIPITSWQVPQSAPNSDGSGVGDLGAFTHTKDSSELFTFNFDEPSILMVCAVARVEHQFAQQVDPHWFRQDKFDEHYPLFDGLGYQPLDKRIPYLPYGVIKDNNGTFPNSTSDVLGFQEYAWEERFTLGNSSGVMNASNPFALRYFLYNELPTENPVGGPEYLSAYRDAEIVDNTLQLGEQASLLAQQLLVNFSWNFIEAKMISKSGKNPGLDRI